MHQPRRKICLLILIFLWAEPLPARAPASRRLTILLSNDDGYSAPGLQALIHAFEPVADVYVAAPADNQSGKGHSITIGQPIYVQDEKQPDGRTYYAIQATPATCVRLGLEALMPKKPDVVISPYYWQMWQASGDDVEGTDVWAFVRGYITLTPLALDETAPQELHALQSLERGLGALTPAKQ